MTFAFKISMTFARYKPVTTTRNSIAILYFELYLPSSAYCTLNGNKSFFCCISFTLRTKIKVNIDLLLVTCTQIIPYKFSLKQNLGSNVF